MHMNLNVATYITLFRTKAPAKIFSWAGFGFMGLIGWSVFLFCLVLVLFLFFINVFLSGLLTCFSQDVFLTCPSKAVMDNSGGLDQDDAVVWKHFQ